jgi:aminocarboxymuconate-semialdehyde decarboxylase
MKTRKKIDMHAHHFPLVDRGEAKVLSAKSGPWLRIDADGDHGQIMRGDEAFRPVERVLWDALAGNAEELFSLSNECAEV